MKAALAIVVVLAASCTAAPVGQQPTDNPEIRIDVVANAAGCQIMRVRGDGTPYRFVVCRDALGAVVPTQTHETRQHCTTTSTGKTTMTTCTEEGVDTPVAMVRR